MAINNFISFATDRIHPDVFTEYQQNHYEEGDFTGADASTLDFTKLGWMISVREKMRVEGTLTNDVDTLINDIFNMSLTTESGTIPNYLALSNGDYNLLQQIVYDNRMNEDFSFDFSYIPNFNTTVMTQLLYSKFNNNQMSAAEMLVEYGLHNAISVLDINRLGTESTENLASKRFSIYMYAYQKAASEYVSIPDGTGKAAKTLNVIRAKIAATPISEYQSFYYKNPKSQALATYPKNELARVCSFLSHDLLVQYIPKIITDIAAPPDGGIFTTALKTAVSGTTGLSSTQVLFNADTYKTQTESNTRNMGYSPLYFYINRYKTECKETVLTELAKAFSPVAVALGPDLNDGFTPLALLSYFLEIDENNHWKNQEIAAFIKSSASFVTSIANTFEAFAALGSVRDFTGGKTNNAFGTVNNIFVKINDKHKVWWAEVSADANNQLTIDDFAPAFNTLSGEVLPGTVFSYSNYKIWMFEYGKELT
jgi:hypothetical protein